MASARSLGTLTVDLVARIAGFTQGMDKAQRAADQSVQKIARTLGTIGTAAAAATAAAGAALISWTGDVVDLGQELGRLAKLSNTTTQEFQKLALGARTVGVENEKFADIVKDMQDRVGDFLQTGGGPMADFFEKIAPKVGVTAEAFRDLSGPNALQLFYDSLEKANLTQSEMIFYLEAMASDTSKLIPLLKNGGAGFEAWGDEAERLGSILDDKTIKATEEMRKASARLDEMVLGLKVNVAEELLPAMESFTGLLGDPKTQDSLRTFSELLGTIAKEAVDAGGVLANFGSQYLGFLKNQGFLPADQLDELDQLQTRAEKIRNYLNKPADPATALFRGLNREAIEKELAGVEAAIKAFPFRDVVSSVTSTYFDPPARKPGGGGGGGGRKAVHELPDFAADAARDLDEMVKKVTDASKEFEALAATLDGPLAEANYRYGQEQEHLNELAKVGEISAQDLAKAQENLAKQHNADVEAINAQLNPSQEYIKALQDEVLWLGATEEGQRKLEAARIAGANATTKQLEEIEHWLETRDQMREVSENWAQLEDNISGGLYDIISGSKSARDGIEDFLDSLNAQILKNLTDDWADMITDWFKDFANSSGGAGGGGGFWAGLLSAVGFGGGKATGGWARANTLYEVNERGLEMATVNGRDYMLTGDKPVHVTPNHRLGGSPGYVQNLNFHLAAPTDTRSQQQIAEAAGRYTRLAMARNG